MTEENLQPVEKKKAFRVEDRLPKLIPHKPELPGAVMCDLDGTLAHIYGRSPYAGDKCATDLLNEPVALVLRQMCFQAGNHLIFMSGRDGASRPQTTAWLASHGFEVGVNCQLFMRAEKDNRNDAIIKEELFMEHVYDKYNVLFVLDDRNRVVDKWREIGLTCFQVAPGDF